MAGSTNNCLLQIRKGPGSWQTNEQKAVAWQVEPGWIGGTLFPSAGSPICISPTLISILMTSGVSLTVSQHFPFQMKKSTQKATVISSIFAGPSAQLPWPYMLYLDSWKGFQFKTILLWFFYILYQWVFPYLNSLMEDISPSPPPCLPSRFANHIWTLIISPTVKMPYPLEGI